MLLLKSEGFIMSYIWQEKNWPHFIYDETKAENSYREYLYASGKLDSIFSSIPYSTQESFIAESLSSETIASSAIEGEHLQYDSVFSSIMKQLDIDYSSKAKNDKYAENVSKVIFDAFSGNAMPTEERVFFWHRLLFESVPKAKAPKSIGEYRNEPVYILHLTGRGEQEIIYEAPPCYRINEEMDMLFRYISEENEERSIVKSAIASLWFVSIHPFSDGNGRISRALADCILSAMEQQKKHYYSISSAIATDKNAYYSMLEKMQKHSGLDITEWITWYIKLAVKAMDNATETCKKKIRISYIMQQIPSDMLNSRQLHILHLLAEGSFKGKLTQEEWMKMVKCKSATATRDLTSLTEKKILIRIGNGSRSFQYLLNPDFEDIIRKL